MARPFQYTFILVLVAISVAAAAVGGWRYARASAPVNGPIIMVSVDTLRADRLPVYGYTGVRTPAIEALAADGIVFERAYSHAPQTLPAHASLLSGRLPFETGVRDNTGFTIKDDERMLAEMLRDRGYATGAVVSSFTLRQESGIDQGFGFFDGELVAMEPDMAGPPIERANERASRVAQEWLSKNGDARAFLFLHLHGPHAPYSAPERFAQYEPYDAEIAHVDEILGELVKYLKAQQLYDQSTIVFLSDHGEGLGDHGEQRHGLFLYEETIRVPLIVKQAAGGGAGRRVADLVQHIDIVPTILDLAKAPVPGYLRGVSLTPLLDGNGNLGERTVYSESLYGKHRFGWSGLVSLTDGRYRYIDAPREELYDIEHDPAARFNRAELDVDVKNRLRDELRRLTSGIADHTPAPIAEADHERFVALGYVTAFALQPTSEGPVAPVDPKDAIEVAEAYRSAIEHMNAGDWTEAIGRLQATVRELPSLYGGWTELGALSLRAGRFELAAQAFERAMALSAPPAHSARLGLATALLRLRRFDEARVQGEAAVAAAGTDRRSRAAAHTLLARIALARHDPPEARREALLAREADPLLPMPSYVDARLLHEQGLYEQALPLFEEALKQAGEAAQRLPQLHYFTADTLARLSRVAEAEHHYLEELAASPHDVRARSALAALYHRDGRIEEARQLTDDLVRITPTREAFSAASRLWTALGDPQAAAQARARARRTPADSVSQ